MTQVSGIEALADAIMDFEGWYSRAQGRTSLSYRNRNPGNLESNGQLLVFPSLVDGYSALLRDLKSKFTAGANTHGLGPDSTLLQLIQAYSPAADSNQPTIYDDFVASWLTLALGTTVTAATLLRDIWTAPGNNAEAVQDASVSEN